MQKLEMNLGISRRDLLKRGAIVGSVLVGAIPLARREQSWFLRRSRRANTGDVVPSGATAGPIGMATP